MRDPSTINEVLDNNNTIIKIDTIPEYDLRDWNLTDPKEFKKYINTIEKKVVRGSFEYRQLVNYLRDNLDMNKCSFYANVSNAENIKIKIHIHHEPLTLYDICLIVYNKRNFFHENLSEEIVGKEVMLLHYKLMVGLIPLAETVHELVHNKYLFIPTDKVYGNYKKFVEMYKDFMLPEQLDMLRKIEEYSKEYNSNDYKNVLERKYIYLDLSTPFPDQEKYDDVIAAMRERIAEIRSPNK